MTSIISNIKSSLISHSQAQTTTLIGHTGKAVGRFRAFFATKNEKRQAIDAFAQEIRQKYGDRFADQTMRSTLSRLRENGSSLKLITARQIISDAKAFKQNEFEANYNKIHYCKLISDHSCTELNKFLDPMLEKKSLHIPKATKERLLLDLHKEVMSHVKIGEDDPYKALNSLPYESKEIEAMIQKTSTFQHIINNANKYQN